MTLPTISSDAPGRLHFDWESFTLSNGLRTVLHVDRAAPLVAVNLWYGVGSRDERAGRTGFAHLFEHLLFQGSEHVGTNAHFELVQRHGGVANGSTWYDRTNYYETLPSQALDLGLWLESDRMGFFESAITQAKLDNQRDVVKNERRTRYDNPPYGTWLERLAALAYPGDHPYGRSVIGSMDDLDAATLDDVRGFFRDWYRPGNAVLTIAGDFDPGEARDRVEAWFGDIPDAPLPSRPPVPVVRLADERRAVVPDDVQLPRIFALWHAPRLADDDFPAADLLATVLATGRSSRLYRRLVYESKVARDVSAFLLPMEASGQFHIQATAREGIAPARLEDELDRELARLLDEPPDDEELERARNRAEADHARQVDPIADRADRFSEAVLLFGDPDRINREIGRYRSVTRDALAAVAARDLVRSNRAVAWYVPRGTEGGLS